MEVTLELHWQCDYAGDEVNFPEVDIVGVYTHITSSGSEIVLLIDMETYQVLDAEIIVE